MNSAPRESARIESNPAILGGRPFIRDTRLSVDFLRGLMATGWSPARILDVYQYLEAADLKGVRPLSGRADFPGFSRNEFVICFVQKKKHPAGPGGPQRKNPMSYTSHDESLKRYMEDIRKTRPISREEEQKLFERCRKGD